ncbi:T9SS type A sorting domain-containing protein [Polluticaenibacter yanchengensis]|uniref:T9SS type A sorting domain-containing protein n=1 Tax=Polluticaenibacter yanchengensis TaxID=3014562 RepID=A0ABT4UH18_9BACT|nr:T9SS type A sorting domain-containing protein [Chitinophagaceae bacterium LY-5]
MTAKNFMLFFVLLALTQIKTALAQKPVIEWQKAIATDTVKAIYVGNYLDDVIGLQETVRDVLPLPANETAILMASQNKFKLVKLNKNGDTSFTRVLNGYFKKIAPTSDGGIVAIGRNSSLTKTVLSKFDKNFNLQWEEQYAGGAPAPDTYPADEPVSVVQAPDGGYALLLSSNTDKGNDKTENAKGENDFWLIKTDDTGLPEWDKTIGGSKNDNPNDIINAPGGGFILSGVSESGKSGDKSEDTRGTFDFWIVKTDAKGTVTWNKTLGTNDWESTAKVYPVSDGFIVAGNTDGGKSGDKTDASLGGSDIWILKFNNSNQLQWQKTIGTANNEDLVLTPVAVTGENLVLAIRTTNVEPDENNNIGMDNDILILKLAAGGNEIWRNLYGGKDSESYLAGITANTDGTVLLVTTSSSGIGRNRTVPNKGTHTYWGNEVMGLDIWVVKIKEEEGSLPVNLVSFTGKNDNGKGLLQWRTAEEENFSKFELQKSTGPLFTSFKLIATIMAAGNNSQYDYTDILDNDKNYYRLKMLDKDGSVAFSQVVTIENVENNHFRILPNPVTAGNNISVHFNKARANAFYQLTGIDGKVQAFKNVAEGSRSLQLNTTGLKSGIYIFIYHNNGSIERSKLVIQ